MCMYARVPMHLHLCMYPYVYASMHVHDVLTLANECVYVCV